MVLLTSSRLRKSGGRGTVRNMVGLLCWFGCRRWLLSYNRCLIRCSHGCMIQADADAVGLGLLPEFSLWMRRRQSVCPSAVLWHSQRHERVIGLRDKAFYDVISRAAIDPMMSWNLFHLHLSDLVASSIIRIVTDRYCILRVHLRQ